MEDVPEIRAQKRLPLLLDIPPYLADHSIDGQPVYPAVEALERLAESVSTEWPGRWVKYSCDAEFMRFLPFSPDQRQAEAVAVLEGGKTGGAGGVSAVLATPFKAKHGPISRTREHVRVTFRDAPSCDHPPLDIACVPEGICAPVPAEKLYEEMVPFGPSFHNALGIIYLSPDGAVGTLDAPCHSRPGLLLGSPFVLDAAFHVACAWGQRFAGKVAFPVGYSERFIFEATKRGEKYYCRVRPLPPEGDVLRFDIRIYDREGRPCEAVLGLKMRDVFKGRMSPPPWVVANTSDPIGPLKAIREACEGMSVVELKGMLPFTDRTLTQREKTLTRTHTPKRKMNFTGARIALKRLARALYSLGPGVDPSTIETVKDDEERPLCAPPGGEARYYCSVSHDDRFAVAVGGRTPIGVDVEKRTEKVLKGSHLYMTSGEKELCGRSSLGRLEAALRVWTSKECAAKALDIPLPDAWSQVSVLGIGEGSSPLKIGEQSIEAHHATVDDHLFTMLTLPRPQR